LFKYTSNILEKPSSITTAYNSKKRQGVARLQQFGPDF
jgi:hypothetical protein